MRTRLPPAVCLLPSASCRLPPADFRKQPEPRGGRTAHGALSRRIAKRRRTLKAEPQEATKGYLAFFLAFFFVDFLAAFFLAAFFFLATGRPPNKRSGELHIADAPQRGSPRSKDAHHETENDSLPRTSLRGNYSVLRLEATRRVASRDTARHTQYTSCSCTNSCELCNTTLIKSSKTRAARQYIFAPRAKNSASVLITLQRDDYPAARRSRAKNQ